MKTKKLSLGELKVQSFTTSADNLNPAGGGGSNNRVCAGYTDVVCPTFYGNTCDSGCAYCTNLTFCTTRTL